MYLHWAIWSLRDKLKLKYQRAVFGINLPRCAVFEDFTKGQGELRAALE